MSVRPSKLVGRVEEAVLFVFLRIEQEWLSVRMIYRDLENLKLSSLYAVLGRLKRDGLLTSRIEIPRGKKGSRSMEVFQLTNKGLGMIVSVSEYNKHIRRDILSDN